MATYTEIRDLYSNDALRNRVEVAVVVAAQAKLAAVTPDPASVAWAAGVIKSPTQAGKSALLAVLAANNTATTAQITGASDAAIQANVDEIVPGLILAG